MSRYIIIFILLRYITLLVSTVEWYFQIPVFYIKYSCPWDVGNSNNIIDFPELHSLDVKPRKTMLNLDIMT